MCSHFSSIFRLHIISNRSFDSISFPIDLSTAHPDLAPPMLGESPPTGNATQEGGAHGNNQEDLPLRLADLPKEQKLFVGNLNHDLDDATFHRWMKSLETDGWYEWEGFL